MERTFDERELEINKGTRETSEASNVTRYVETYGLDAATIWQNQPRFFLFADVDSKEHEQLRQILQFYKQKNLSVYFYETTKGWHVISPCLLSLRRWTRYCNCLRNLMQYSFDTIRLSWRLGDGTKLYFENWNSNVLWESYDLHYLIRQKFGLKIPTIRPCFSSTVLTFSHYNQLRLKNKYFS